MKYWLWAIPDGESDRLYERPLTDFALTPKECERVTAVASGDGWHSFRRVLDTPDAPDFAVTVKALDMFGVVHDTHATEAELNGWRPTQGAML